MEKQKIFSPDFFEDVFRYTSAQMIIVDREGRIIAVNDAKQRSSDRIAEVGMRMYIDYAANHTVADMRAELMKYITEGGLKNFPECPYNGKILNITINAFPWGAVIVSEDITRFKRCEERYRTLLMNIDCMAIQIYKMDGTVIDFNGAALKLYGFTREQVCGKNLLDLIIPPDMRDGVWQCVQDMAKTRIPIPSSELQLMRSDGTFVNVFSSHWLFENYEGELELVCVDVDLTELKSAQVALQKSEELLRAITQSALDAIVVMDPDKNISFFNPAAERLTGYTKEQAIRQPLHELLAPEACRSQCLAGIERFLSTGEGPAVGRITDQKILREDGSTVDVQLALSPMTIGDKRGSVGILRDNTNQNAMIKALKKSREELLRLSTTDPLTELYNRRHFEFELRQAIDFSQRYGLPFSAVMFDVDDFKIINDHHGHGVGDCVLQAIASVTKENIRSNDIPCRIGGEEFFIIFPATTKDEAYVATCHIATALKAKKIEGISDEQITLSCGVVQYDPKTNENEDAFRKRADKLMYEAKDKGKDQICL
ncbi:MAG: PAS domain S-box protein [Parcubacteria group bacterium]|jgi:diguanylate cyclase (GGDEF)-like protein/PAS domain S-box-containing protein